MNVLLFLVLYKDNIIVSLDKTRCFVIYIYIHPCAILFLFLVIKCFVLSISLFMIILVVFASLLIFTCVASEEFGTF